MNQLFKVDQHETGVGEHCHVARVSSPDLHRIEAAGSNHHPNNSFQQVKSLGAATMFDNPIQGITSSYLARHHSNAFVDASATLLDVCRLLAMGAHRVAVLNAEKRVTTIVSQTAIIKYIGSLVRVTFSCSPLESSCSQAFHSGEAAFCHSTAQSLTTRCPRRAT